MKQKNDPPTEIWDELADAFDKLVHHYTLTETLLRKAHNHGFINGEYQSLNINIESSWNEFKKLNNINKEYEPLNDKI